MLLRLGNKYMQAEASVAYSQARYSWDSGVWLQVAMGATTPRLAWVENVT